MFLQERNVFMETLELLKISHRLNVPTYFLLFFFSGESGAGKTVSAKHIMNFIAKASGKGSEKVEV